MGKIFCIMGKSGTGKDTILRALLENEKLGLKKIVPYTTRPIRTGEVDGDEYHFCDRSHMEKLIASGTVIEKRTYHTMHGEWDYFTVDDGQVDLENGDYALIGTLPVFTSLCSYYSKDRIVPIYIEIDDGLRLSRALGRERKQSKPKYEEMCRRFLADAEDFSEENLTLAGIKKRFMNDNLKRCLGRITSYVQKKTKA